MMPQKINSVFWIYGNTNSQDSRLTGRSLRMCSREKLCTLGFPVSASQAVSMGVPMLGITDVARASQIAGNCMNFSCVCMVQLIALCCFRMKCISESHCV